MIENLEHLRATQAYLSSMEEGLARLLSSLPAEAGSRRDLLTQPYDDEIDRVRGEIDEFLKREKSRSVPESTDLMIGLRGRGLRLGSAPISIVTGTVDAIRRGLQALAALLQGREPGLGGRPGRDIEAACDFRLLSVGDGSVTVSLGLPESPQLDLLPTEALGGRAAEWFVQVASWASRDASDDLFPSVGSNLARSPESLPALAAWQVVKTLPRDGSVLDEIVLDGRLVPRGRITLNKFTRDRLYRIIDKGQRKVERSVEGYIRGLDLDSGTFFLRITGRQQRLRCFFEPLFQDSIIDGAGLKVKVSGLMLMDAVTNTERALFARTVQILGARPAPRPRARPKKRKRRR